MSIIENTTAANMDSATTMEYRGRVFGKSVTTEKVSVDENGIVRAWDDVAQHWTTCHSITSRGIRAIQNEAVH